MVRLLRRSKVFNIRVIRRIETVIDVAWRVSEVMDINLSLPVALTERLQYYIVEADALLVIVSSADQPLFILAGR
jgi:hypothetical protein